MHVLGSYWVVEDEAHVRVVGLLLTVDGEQVRLPVALAWACEAAWLS